MRHREWTSRLGRDWLGSCSPPPTHPPCWRHTPLLPLPADAATKHCLLNVAVVVELFYHVTMSPWLLILLVYVLLAMFSQVICWSKVTYDNTNISGHTFVMWKHSSTATVAFQTVFIVTNANYFLICTIPILKPNMSWIMHFMSAFYIKLHVKKHILTIPYLLIKYKFQKSNNSRFQVDTVF